MALPADLPSSAAGEPVATPVAAGGAVGERGPGALRGEASLVLHTRHGQQLYSGRAPVMIAGKWAPAIIGIGRFAILVRNTAAAARAGCPWADWTLVQIDRELAAVGDVYAGLDRRLDAILAGCPGISIQVALSVDPLVVPIRFASAYAFKAAETIATFDALACKVLTAAHTGRIPVGEGHALLQDAKRHARRLLQIPARYRFSGATRDDVVKGTQRGADAVARYGLPPDEILHRQVRPLWDRGEGLAAAALDDGDDAVELPPSGEPAL